MSHHLDMSTTLVRGKLTLNSRFGLTLVNNCHGSFDKQWWFIFLFRRSIYKKGGHFRDFRGRRSTRHSHGVWKDLISSIWFKYSQQGEFTYRSPLRLK